MIISVVNFSKSEIPGGEIQRAVRAINRRLARDIEPYVIQ